MAKAATWPSEICPTVSPAMKSCDLTARESGAVALLADDFLRQHYSASRSEEAGEQRLHRSAALAPSRLVSSWLGEAPSMPAARLVMTERAATSGRSGAREWSRARSTCRPPMPPMICATCGFRPAFRRTGRSTRHRRLGAAGMPPAFGGLQEPVAQRGIIGIGHGDEILVAVLPISGFMPAIVDVIGRSA